MTYLRDKQRQKNTIIGTTVFLIVLVLCFAFRTQLFKVFSPVGGFISSTFSFLQTPYDVVTNFAFAGISSKANLIAQNEDLIGKVAQGDALRERIVMLESDVARLEKMNATSTYAYKGIIARRIHTPESSLYNTLVIDQGTRANVLQGDLLIGEGGTLLGTVEEVFGSTARGLLFSAPNITTEATVVAPSTIPMTLQGLGSGSFFARVPQGVEIPVGSVVASQQYPKWHIGEVVNIERKPQDPFQTIFIKASESPYTILFVKVIHNE